MIATHCQRRTLTTALPCAADGAEVQDTLQGMTGQRTVPQVFIAEEFLGGASETLALHEQGEIVKKLDAAGVQHQ